MAQALEAIDVPIYSPSLLRGSRTRLTFLPEVSRQLMQSLGKGSWDLVLTDSIETTPLAFSLATVLRLPLVVRVRGDVWAEIEQGGQRGVAMRLPGVRVLVNAFDAILRRTAYVVPVSHYLRECVLRQVDIPASRVEPIPVSVDVSAFSGPGRVEARRALGWGGAEPIVLSVTNFRFPKKVVGLEDLCPAMRHLMELRPGLRWVVVGSGPYLESFRRHAQPVLGAAVSRLATPGYVGNIASYYAASNVVVYFTGLDAFPRAVLEAQAAGRVVIANPIAGVPEMITHGVTGYLTEPGDGFLAIALNVLDNPALEISIGKAARESVARNYSPEGVGARWLSVLNAAVNQGAPG